MHAKILMNYYFSILSKITEKALSNMFIMCFNCDNVFGNSGLYTKSILNHLIFLHDK